MQTNSPHVSAQEMTTIESIHRDAAIETLLRAGVHPMFPDVPWDDLELVHRLAEALAHGDTILVRNNATVDVRKAMG